MREKKESLIITFSTTAEAMKTEKYCEENQLPGRLIPVPREITAGCGLAWKAAPGEVDVILDKLKAAGVRWEEARILKV